VCIQKGIGGERLGCREKEKGWEKVARWSERVRQNASGGVHKRLGRKSVARIQHDW